MTLVRFSVGSSMWCIVQAGTWPFLGKLFKHIWSSLKQQIECLSWIAKELRDSCFWYMFLGKNWIILGFHFRYLFGSFITGFGLFFYSLRFGIHSDKSPLEAIPIPLFLIVLLFHPHQRIHYKKSINSWWSLSQINK